MFTEAADSGSPVSLSRTVIKIIFFGLTLQKRVVVVVVVVVGVVVVDVVVVVLVVVEVVEVVEVVVVVMVVVIVVVVLLVVVVVVSGSIHVSPQELWQSQSPYLCSKVMGEQRGLTAKTPA
jgi:hypothetical protein